MARGHGNRGRALAALVLILFGTAAPVFADKADPLVTGIKTFEQGKYDAAIKLLTTAFDDKTRTRRDHMKYLALIRVIALLHQHQRPVRTLEREGAVIDYIEVTPADIAAANRLRGRLSLARSRGWG